MIDSLARPLKDLNWHDLEAVASENAGVLEELSSEPLAVIAALERVFEDERLLALSEHYDILDKIVLYDDPAGLFRIRLHVFRPGYFDRPHNHRWTYSSRVVAGAYRHFVYGPDADFDETTPVSSLTPSMIRIESVGSSYTLHHSVVHSVVAEPWTISLIVRGPAEKERFLVMDKTSGKAWWQYGAKDETEAERAEKRLSSEGLEEIVRIVGDRLSAQAIV